MSAAHGPVDHEAFNEDVAAYLLGALPPEDKERFEGHLADCRLCRADVERLQVAADALPAAAPPVLPPPALKGRIMAAVEAEASLLAAAGARADRPEAPATAEAPARRRGLAERLLAGLRPALAIPAALLLLVLGGVGGAVLLRPEPETRVERVPVPAPPELRRYPAAIDPAELPRGEVTLEVVGESGRLVGDGMEPAPRGRIYQVWVIPEGSDQPRPTRALFGARRDGTAVVAVPGSLDGVDKVLVNHEPLGGSSTPTKQPFITVDL